ncbi:MAG TPA: D-alanyl-D-alanine carboxypeptidase family protein [Candidatus Tectomicrobia bacterium]|nr:D-alanyl-D-alanine carboxypeptidase family protein [Candidatus Tectomicrobia bacterium]
MPRDPLRRGLLWALVVSLCVTVVISLAQAGERARRKPANPSAPPPIEAVVLMEAATGAILFEKDMHKQRAPASMVKMMLMLIVMEKLHAGELHLSDPITATALAAKMGGSQVYLREGETFTLEEMMKAISIASANDACVAVAEHISGTVEGFLDLMNERAKALGLDDSHFESVHGLPTTNGTPGDLTSAYDMAMLARELTKYPEILSWGAMKEESLRDGKFILTNTNKLVYHHPGVDGLKTGFHAQAGFNVTATAQRDGLRMIVVVMGAPNSTVRFDEAKRLLAMGFNSYRKVVVVRKDASVGPEIQVSGSTVRRVRAVVQEEVAVVVKKGVEKQLITDVQVPKDLSAPVHRGQVIGEVRVKHQDQILIKTAAVVPEEIPKVSLLWRLFGR